MKRFIKMARIIGAEKALLLLLGLSLLVPGLARGEKSAASATPTPVKQLLQEVNEHFTLRGKPIHPRLVEKFQTFLSDSGPPAVITVDLLAAARLGNEYDDGDVKRREGFVEVKKGGEEKGEFAYKWLGTVRPGLHVVEAFDNGGGTGIFMDLYFFRISLGAGRDDQGRYEQILMTLARTPVILGDRDDGAIKVEPGRVIIGKSRYREKPVILQFK